MNPVIELHCRYLRSRLLRNYAQYFEQLGTCESPDAVFDEVDEQIRRLKALAYGWWLEHGTLINLGDRW